MTSQNVGQEILDGIKETVQGGQWQNVGDKDAERSVTC